MQRQGSTQVGLAKRFFQNYQWFRFEPKPETVAWAGDAEAVKSDIAPLAAGIGDEVRVIYLLIPRQVLVKQLKSNTDYSLTSFDPVTGEQTSLGMVRTDNDGTWRSSLPNSDHDWVFILKYR